MALLKASVRMMTRLLMVVTLSLIWPACDSGTSDAGPAPEPTSFRVQYLVDGDVGVATDILYSTAAGETVSTGQANVPFRFSETFQPDQTATLSVVAVPFNPFQPNPNHEVMVVTSILIDDIIAATDTVRGVRFDTLRTNVQVTLPGS